MENDFNLLIEKDDVQKLTLSYVADSPRDDRKEGETGGNMLVIAEIHAQNDIINIDFDACNTAKDIDLTAQDLRDLADTLVRWADISDSLMLTQEDIESAKL